MPLEHVRYGLGRDAGLDGDGMLRAALRDASAEALDDLLSLRNRRWSWGAAALIEEAQEFLARLELDRADAA